MRYFVHDKLCKFGIFRFDQSHIYQRCRLFSQITFLQNCCWSWSRDINRIFLSHYMAALLGFIPAAVQLVAGLLNSRSEKPNERPTVNTNNNRQLEEELRRYREENRQLLARFDALLEQMKREKIETFEDLANQDQQAKNALIQLARQTKPQQLEGYNIGLFGITSTGKSTMLNALLDLKGENRAKTGAGETTMKVTSYQGTGYTLWDVPGRNDEVSYLSMEYISFFKGLSKILILIQATVQENSSLMKMLDAIGVNYDIVFNKFDMIEEEERESLKSQIKSEVQRLGLQKVKKIYFVSAKNPKTFDWLTMVHDLTS